MKLSRTHDGELAVLPDLDTNLAPDYRQSLHEAVPLSAWMRIVERAAADAEQGCHKAREWLSRYLLDPTPRSDPRPLDELIADLTRS